MNESHVPFASIESAFGLPREKPAFRLLDENLLRPVEDLLSRPSKRFRESLVETGFRLAQQGSEIRRIPAKKRAHCGLAADLIEMLHSGSLIIDDIQDGSPVRRGKPAIHLRYGTPLAINAGNWMYFWPLRRLRDAGLPAKLELELYRRCHETLSLAHAGQALDLSGRIDEVPQSQVPEICATAAELKSGALMSLAISLGGVLGGASPERLATLERFGRRFGKVLQMFDDLGNLSFSSPAGYPSGPRRHEDLYLRRPSWVWSYAASNFSEKDYADFIRAVSALPDESFLKPWLEIHEFLPRAREAAGQELESALSELELALGGYEIFPQTLAVLRELADRLVEAYGS